VNYNISRTVEPHGGANNHRDIDLIAVRQNSNSNSRNVIDLTTTTSKYGKYWFETYVASDTEKYSTSRSFTNQVIAETKVREKSTEVESKLRASSYYNNHRTSGTFDRGQSVTQNYTRKSATIVAPDGKTIEVNEKSNYKTSNVKGLFEGFVGLVSTYQTVYRPTKEGEGDTVSISHKFGGTSVQRKSITKYRKIKASKWMTTTTPTSMTAGDHQVTTETKLSYSDYSTHKTTSSYRENGGTIIYDITNTCTTERTTNFKFRTTDTKKVLTFAEDPRGRDIEGNQTVISGFNLSADSPFHSFMVCDIDEYEKLVNRHVSHQFKGTLCKEVVGAEDDAETVALVPDKRFVARPELPKSQFSTLTVNDYISTYSYVFTREPIANLGETESESYKIWVETTVGECGHTDRVKSIVLAPAEHERKTYYIGQRYETVQYFGISADKIPSELVEGLTYKNTKMGLKDYTSYDTNGNTLEVSYTTIRSTVRFTGKIQTGTGSDRSDTDKTVEARTVNIPAEAGRKVRYLYDTVSTSAFSHAYTSETYEEVPVRHGWRYNLTYVTYKKLDHFRVSSDICFTGETYPYTSSSVQSYAPFNETEVTDGVCGSLKTRQMYVDYQQGFQEGLQEGERTSPAGIPYYYKPMTYRAFSTIYHRCGRKEAVKTTRAVRTVPNNESYVMSFNIGSNISSTKLYDTNWVQSKTITYKAVLSSIGDTPYLDQEFITSNASMSASYSITGRSTTQITSGQLRTTDTISGTLVVKADGGDSTSVSSYTITHTYYEHNSKKEPYTSTTVWDAGAGNTAYGFSKDYKFTYEYVPQKVLYAHSDILRHVYRQYYLNVYEPVINMQNHWQDESDYGVDKPFYTDVANTNFIPVRRGGAHYYANVGSSPYFHPDNTNAIHAWNGSNGHAANLPILDAPYLIFSSSKTYTYSHFRKGVSVESTRTLIAEKSSSNFPIFTYSTESDTEFVDNIGITGFTPTITNEERVSSNKMYHVAEINNFSSTKFDTYTSSTTTSSAGDVSTQSTKFIASQFTYERPIANTYLVRTSLAGEINDELFSLNFMKVSPMGVNSTYYESAYNNRTDLPYNVAGVPIRPMYAVGGVLFNGRERSATIVCEFKDAEVEMFHTEYNNGKRLTNKNNHRFDFSFTTAGTRVSHIRAVQALEYFTSDRAKAYDIKKGTYRGFSGGSPDVMLYDYNACMVAIPQLPMVRLGTKHIIGHDPSMLNTVSPDHEEPAEST